MHARASDTLNEATRGVTPRAQRQLVATLEQIKHNLDRRGNPGGLAEHNQEPLVMAEPRLAKPVRARA